MHLYTAVTRSCLPSCHGRPVPIPNTVTHRKNVGIENGQGVLVFLTFDVKGPKVLSSRDRSKVVTVRQYMLNLPTLFLLRYKEVVVV